MEISKEIENPDFKSQKITRKQTIANLSKIKNGEASKEYGNEKQLEKQAANAKK